MVEAEREVVGQAATVERRYFISSLGADAKQALRAVRGHWEVENSLHWVLDVAFREDACRTRTGHAPENLATLRHIAVNLLKQERSCKLGIKSKRLKAGWDEIHAQGAEHLRCVRPTVAAHMREGESLFNLSLALAALGQRAQAIDCAEAALKISVECDGLNSAKMREQLSVLRGLG
jgi:predicted transposase YbfD/YdcC